MCDSSKDQYCEELLNVVRHCKGSSDEIVDLSDKVFGARVY